MGGRTSPTQPGFCRQNETTFRQLNCRFSPNLATTRESMNPQSVSGFTKTFRLGVICPQHLKIDGGETGSLPYPGQPTAQGIHCRYCSLHAAFQGAASFRLSELFCT